jgi:hypothetical protein
MVLRRTADEGVVVVFVMVDLVVTEARDSPTRSEDVDDVEGIMLLRVELADVARDDDAGVDEAVVPAASDLRAETVEEAFGVAAVVAAPKLGREDDDDELLLPRADNEPDEQAVVAELLRVDRFSGLTPAADVVVFAAALVDEAAAERNGTRVAALAGLAVAVEDLVPEAALVPAAVADVGNMLLRAIPALLLLAVVEELEVDDLLDES